MTKDLIRDNACKQIKPKPNIIDIYSEEKKVQITQIIFHLDDNYMLRPSGIPDVKICSTNKNEYLFFDCVNNIHEVRLIHQ